MWAHASISTGPGAQPAILLPPMTQYGHIFWLLGVSAAEGTGGEAVFVMAADADAAVVCVNAGGGARETSRGCGRHCPL